MACQSDIVLTHNLFLYKIPYLIFFVYAFYVIFCETDIKRKRKVLSMVSKVLSFKLRVGKVQMDQTTGGFIVIFSYLNLQIQLMNSKFNDFNNLV